MLLGCGPRRPCPADGDLVKGTSQRRNTVVSRGAGLRYEGRAQRMVTGDQEFVATMEPLDVAQVRRAIRLLKPAVAAGAGEDQVPDAIDRRAAEVLADGPREHVIHLAPAHLPTMDLDRCEAVEAVPLLVAVQGASGAGDVRPAPRDDKGLADRLELHGEQMLREVQFPGRLDQPPSLLDLLLKIVPMAALEQ